MFRIGDFARLNKLSVKTLRYYDEIGILKPVSVDEETGYRYYSASQLPRLNKIIALKSLGFPLSQIKDIFEHDYTEEIIISILRKREEEIKDELEQGRQKLLNLQSLLKVINEEEEYMSNYDVIIKKVEPLKVASIREIIPEYCKQDKLWMELNEFLDKNNIKKVQPCLVVYYDPGFKESDVDAEIAEHIVGDAKGTDRINIKDLPEVEKMACLIHKGSYEMLPKSYNMILKWIEENGYRPCGPNRELYLDGEWSGKTPEECITEIQIPVEKIV